MAVLFKDRIKRGGTLRRIRRSFRLTLVEHLEELRTRLIRCILILGAAWVAGWQFVPYAYGEMTQRMVNAIMPVMPKGAEYKEAFFHAPDAFPAQAQAFFLYRPDSGLPLVLLQLWGFIEPALKPAERAPVRRVAPFSLILFAMGAAFSWWIMPEAMRWFATYIMEFPGHRRRAGGGTLSFFVLKMMLAFGISFQLPLIVYIMGRSVAKAETLFQYWRHARRSSSSCRW
ncbi:hypothetical protein U1Q18_052108 [Sarracenia purpurea var. burkii]